MSRSITVATVVLFSTAAIGGANARVGEPQTAPPANPQTAAPSAPSQQTPTSVTTTVTTTLVGCLYREDQVPGRRPNVGERAGILEDYILAHATMASEQGKPAGTSGVSGASSNVPASGSMYKVEKIPDERLKALLGKRVEVTGRIDPQRARAPGTPGSATGAPTPDIGPSPDKVNLPELEASSIREVSGECPATPAPLK